ncbi:MULTISPECIES: endonuclease/exonuclease/phosphatase family protein [Aeromonas]|uniref:endonuclease/exonuclease/phosphatase family protein n=1 Tax=Aeromonas TaxID=642 RepID=UPI0037C12582
MLVYRLRFGWWNAALSPSAPQAKTKADKDTYQVVCEHINSLLQVYNCDFLALCELSSADVAHIESNIDLDNFATIDLTDKVGRTRFDIMVIYNKRKIRAQKNISIAKPMTDQIIKAAQLVDIENIDDGKKIHIYLCHWASRLNGSGTEKRIASAQLVYSSAEKYMAADGDVIIIGDFNDNPYDLSLNKILHASRCHDAVRAYPKEYFYNPFWRSIVSEQKYCHSTNSGTYRSGSHRYKEFQGTMWHSYDQAIVSGSFVSNKYWHLNEYETKIVTYEAMLESYEDSTHFIDHLPIICEINRA